MRTPLLRLLAVVLTGAMIAAACSDDPDTEALIDEILGADADGDTGTDTDPDVDEPPDLDGPIPAATAPDPDNTPLRSATAFRTGPPNMASPICRPIRCTGLSAALMKTIGLLE